MENGPLRGAIQKSGSMAPSILGRDSFGWCMSRHCGRRGGSVVNASDLGPEGREFEPSWVFLK